MYAITNKNTNEILKVAFETGVLTLAQQNYIKKNTASILGINENDLLFHYEPDNSSYAKRVYKGDEFTLVYGPPTALDFSVEDNKPKAVVTMDKNVIDGNNPADIVNITVTLDKPYTGTIYCDIKGPVGLFPKILEFDNETVNTFQLHSNKFGYYKFPANRIKEFKHIEPLTLTISWK